MPVGDPPIGGKSLMRRGLKRLEEASLRTKLGMASLLPSIVVLLLAALAFVIYDSISFRTVVLRNLEANAHFIALASRAGLQLGTLDYVQQAISGLASNGDVTSAAVYNAEGSPVVIFPRAGNAAGYPRLSGKDFPATPRGKIWLFQPITLEEEQIGTVFIEASFGRFWRRFHVLAIGACAGLLLLFLLAYRLSNRMQRHITHPLMALAQTARAVSERKDYSARAQSQRGPEFRTLTEAFNQMLEQIQLQDAELRTRAAQLEQANAELESFTYTVAHDLRSPLRSLAGFSYLLSNRDAKNLSEEGCDFLKRIRASAERMAGLIDDLLAFSHLDTQPVRVEEADLGAIASCAYREVEPLAQDRVVQLRVDPLPPAKADPALLHQVYVNLLSNAVKYTRSRAVAEIHVGARHENGKAVYFVEDNGIGFDMRHAQNLFRVFQRLHSAEDFEGTGVGLAIVQRIIARHGGRIWPEAEPDKGATFYFTLG
jgi:signal transduction histidine kinase